MFSGLPPSFSTQQHMRSIDKALGIISKHAPSSLNALVPILKLTISAMDTLGNPEKSSLFLPLVQSYSSQLDELKRATPDSWSSELEIEWCNSKLYIYALAFTIPASTDQELSTQIWVHRQTILHEAFEVASTLIAQFSKLSQLGASSSHDNDLLRATPDLYFTSLFNATTFLFRFMATSVNKTPTQSSQAINMVIEAHKIFQSRPQHRELTRAAIHIESLIEILKQGAPAGMNELVVKDKLGASVMFDAIFHACRHRNIDPETFRPLPAKEWKTVNDTFAERLPKVPSPNLGIDIGASKLDDSGPEPDQQSTELPENDPLWWEDWDKYLNLAQVPHESLDLDLLQ